MGEGERSFIRIPTGKGIVVPFSILAVIGSALALGQQVYGWYETRLASHAKRILEEQETRSRINKIEYWQCRVGWNPPVSVNPNRDCSLAALKLQREE